MMAHGGSSEVLGADSAAWDSMANMMEEVMQGRFGAGQVFWQLHWILAFMTWVLFIILLIALVRWLWKKGDKVK